MNSSDDSEIAANQTQSGRSDSVGSHTAPARSVANPADGSATPEFKLTLPAADVGVALDLAADQGAEHAADDGAAGAVAAAVDAAAHQGADAGADHQAGRAVAAAAIIAAVRPAIDLVI